MLYCMAPEVPRAEGHGLSLVQNHWIFSNFNAFLKNFQIFAVGKDKDIEIFRKFMNLTPPPLTLQLPQHLCMALKVT